MGFCVKMNDDLEHLCNLQEEGVIIIIITQVIYITRYLTDKGEHTMLYKIMSTNIHI